MIFTVNQLRNRMTNICVLFLNPFQARTSRATRCSWLSTRFSSKRPKESATRAGRHSGTSSTGKNWCRLLERRQVLYFELASTSLFLFLFLCCRAKWDAWNRLGDMPKEAAMQKYVDELKKVRANVTCLYTHRKEILQLLSEKRFLIHH